MLITGHIQLLDDVLMQLTGEELQLLMSLPHEHYSESFGSEPMKDSMNDSMNDSMKDSMKEFKKGSSAELALYQGLIFPDLPCSRRVLENEGHVTHDKVRACPFVRIASMSVGLTNKLSEIYASHKGAFSINHAMSPAADHTVAQVRDATLVNMLVMLATAIHDDTTRRDSGSGTQDNDRQDKERQNLFWLGAALHTLMDAYSPAHVVRMGRDNIDYGRIRSELVRIARPSVSAKLVRVRARVSRAHGALRNDTWALQMYAGARAYADSMFLSTTSRKAKNDFVKDPDTLIDGIVQTAIRICPDHCKSLAVPLSAKERTKLLQAFLMYGHAARMRGRYGIDRAVQLSCSRSSRSRMDRNTKIKDNSIAKKDNSIVSMFNYGLQHGSWHMKHDVLSYLHKYGLYDELIHECVVLIRVFLKSLVSPSSTKVSSGIKAYAQHAMCGPFRIADGFADLPCVITAAVLQNAKV